MRLRWSGWRVEGERQQGCLSLPASAFRACIYSGNVENPKRDQPLDTEPAGGLPQKINWTTLSLLVSLSVYESMKRLLRHSHRAFGSAPRETGLHLEAHALRSPQRWRRLAAEACLQRLGSVEATSLRSDRQPHNGCGRTAGLAGVPRRLHTFSLPVRVTARSAAAATSSCSARVGSTALPKNGGVSANAGKPVFVLERKY